MLAISFAACKYNGVWHLEGYGFCIKSSFGFVKFYQATKNMRIYNKDYSGIIVFNKLYCGLGKFKLVKDGEALLLENEQAQTKYKFAKVNPEYLYGKIEADESPKIMFQGFYEAFKENYAFFHLYDTDIAEKYNDLSTKISDETTDEELFKFMCELIDGLDDAHVYINYKDESYSFHKEPDWYADREKLLAITDLIRSKYVKDYKMIDKCPIRYGTLNEDAGYIMLRGMGIEELDQTKRMNRHFSSIMDKFIDKKAIVIDMRFNGGGYDSASLACAGYFAKEPYLAYAKQSYCDGYYTDLQESFVYPQGKIYEGKVIVLTSGYTVSAGETFITALKANPNIDLTIIGSETAGNYSDCIPRKVSAIIDISYGLSTERYLSCTGEALEGEGIEPDIFIPVDYGKTQAGTDEAIERALETAKNSTWRQ